MGRGAGAARSRPRRSPRPAAARRSSVSANECLLEMILVAKSFPGVRALDDVTLKVRPGTVHALMGENGAGKSTLMKCLFGIYQPDSGTILIDGKEVTFA